MALKLVIKPVVDYSRPKREAKQFTDELRRQDTAAKTLGQRLNHVLNFDVAKGFDRVAERAKAAGRAVSSTLRDIGKSAQSVTGNVEGMFKRVFNLRNALLGSAIGAGTYSILSRTLHEGSQQIAAEGRVRRFEKSSGMSIFGLGRTTGIRAGVQEDEALRAIVPLAEAIAETTNKGAVRGGKRLNTEQFRARNLEKARSLYERVQTLAPEIPPEQLGQMLAAAGTGPEGLRGLAGALGINRAIVARVRKEAAKKHMGQGDVLERLLASAGITEEAATSKRGKFEFQVKSIGAQLEDALGDVGRTAMERLNESFGKGVTLADRLQKYLASPEGKHMIDQLGDSLSKVVGFVADLAQKIPNAIGWVVDHKETLKSLAVLYGGLKVAGLGAGLAGGAKGAAETLGGLAGGGKNGIPVYVTNWGGTPGAGGAPGAGGGGAGGAAKKFTDYIPILAAVAAADQVVGNLKVAPGINIMDLTNYHTAKAKLTEFAKKNYGAAGSVPSVKVSGEQTIGDLASMGPLGFPVAAVQGGSTAGNDTHVNVYLDSTPVAARVEKKIVERAKNSSPTQ